MLRRSSIHRILPLGIVSLVTLCGCPALTQPQDEPVILADPPPSVSTVAMANAPPPPPPPAPTPTPMQPTPPPPEQNEEKIQASHILVSWKGAMRSAQTRTKPEAKKRIDEVVAKLKKGEDFGKLAAVYGEDGTKSKGGDLGLFGHGAMIAPFESAAFALKVGEVSGIVETPFGFHVIKRTK